ncbi:MAG: hypothetical protein NZ108_01665 [Bacteroidia bacterium]|nr:hypothetical protein [Bacteroidia bacterium]
MLVCFSACQTNKPDETQIQAWNQFVAEFPKIELPIDFHSSTKDDFSMELDQLREIPVEQVQKFINPDYKATQRDYLNYYYYGAVNLSPQLTGLLVTKFQSGVVTLSLQIFSQKDLQRTSEVLLFESTMQDNPVGFAEIISRVRKDLKVKVVQIMDMISTESPLARHATIHEYQILPDGKIQDLGIREAESKLEDSEDF